MAVGAQEGGAISPPFAQGQSVNRPGPSAEEALDGVRDIRPLLGNVLNLNTFLFLKRFWLGMEPLERCGVGRVRWCSDLGCTEGYKHMAGTSRSEGIHLQGSMGLPRQELSARRLTLRHAGPGGTPVLFPPSHPPLRRPKIAAGWPGGRSSTAAPLTSGEFIRAWRKPCHGTPSRSAS
jgi:hypothetical protein